jgi:curli biogenesis system outer membrane secretion channel CsgG
LLEREPIALEPTPCGADAVVLSLSRENHAVRHKYRPASGELNQLTHGKDDQYPACTPDEKTVFYQRSESPPTDFDRWRKSSRRRIDWGRHLKTALTGAVQASQDFQRVHRQN